MRTLSFAIAFASFLLLPACSTYPQLRQGMTKEEVTAKLGKPIRVEPKAGGLETWYYTAVSKDRSTGFEQNYNRPGESVYERDLRIHNEGGVTTALEITTSERYDEQPVHFDRDGRLLATPPHLFLPRE